MFNAKIIFKILGMLLFIEALMFACTCGVAIFYEEGNLHAYIVPFLVSVTLGILLRFLGRGGNNGMSRRDGYLCVTLSWIVFSIVGTLPFLFSGCHIDLSHAFFESMSGFTTTGATAIDDVDALPRSLLFMRSLTHWLGGMGIVFFTIIILPGMGKGNLKLFSAEASGLKMGRLHPRISTTARWLWGVYFFLTVSCLGAYYLAGMPLFDAVNHAFSTVSTGGFSTHTASIGYFHSDTIEVCVTVFMFLSGINFTLIYLFFIKWRVRTVLRDSELRTYIVTLSFGALCMAAMAFFSGKAGAGDALRQSFFYAASLQSCTGFTTINVMLWPTLAWMILIILSAFGACAGSTTGGIKCIRVLTGMKIFANEFRHLLHPNAVLPIRINRNPVASRVAHTVFAFFVAYILLVLLGVIVFITLGTPILDSVSCTLSMISNAGPVFGHHTGPLDSCYQMSDAGLWFASILMLAGRLEIFTLLLPFYAPFWRDH